MTPVSRGGSDELDNLVTACLRCNLAKYNRTVSEFLEHDAYIRYLLKNDPSKVRVAING